MSDSPVRPMEEVEVSSVSPVSSLKSGQDASTDSIRYYGVLKSMGESYGFIECCLTQDLYDRDVYLTRSQLPGGTFGTAVSFQVRLNHNGQPQARQVRQETCNVTGSPGRELVAFERKIKASIRYHGVLKSLGDTFGFIKCLPTYEIFERDVFVTKSDLPRWCKVWEAVSFQVHLNHYGLPRAKEVRLEAEEDLATQPSDATWEGDSHEFEAPPNGGSLADEDEDDDFAERMTLAVASFLAFGDLDSESEKDEENEKVGPAQVEVKNSEGSWMNFQ